MNLSWLDLYLCEDLDLAVRLFTERMNDLLDRLAPIIVIQVVHNYAPWLTVETKQLMREHDIAQHRASVTNIETDWHYYRQLRNQVTVKLKSEKSQWQMTKLKVMGQDAGKVWKNLKDWYGCKSH